MKEIIKLILYSLSSWIDIVHFKFFWLADNISGPHINTMPINNIVKSKDTQTSCQNGHFILKISGCWTTPVSYGITYKFSRVSP